MESSYTILNAVVTDFPRKLVTVTEYEPYARLLTLELVDPVLHE